MRTIDSRRNVALLDHFMHAFAMYHVLFILIEGTALACFGREAMWMRKGAAKWAREDVLREGRRYRLKVEPVSRTLHKTENLLNSKANINIDEVRRGSLDTSGLITVPRGRLKGDPPPIIEAKVLELKMIFMWLQTFCISSLSKGGGLLNFIG